LNSALNSSSASSTALTGTGLACRRGTRQLFHGLALDVAPGRLVWVRGRNGRGKTSLLRLVAGLAEPEHGQLLRAGAPVRRSAAHARELVFIGHHNALKDDLDVTEALQFLLRVHGRPCAAATVDAALDRLGLAGRRHAFVRTLSQGQRRRVALARLAVDVTQPRASLWLLDEPFDALDVDGVASVEGLLHEHLGRGGSVLMTSHLPVNPELRPVNVDLDVHA
jgi:heme exporter protein A